MPAWELWRFAHSQWRISPAGGLFALDYGAVFEIARGMNIPMHKGNLERIQALERATLEKQEKAAK